MIPVITLYQPWASLIADGHKTIETRTHDRFRSLLGRYVAIHAGGHYDYGCVSDASGEDRLSFITKEKYGDRYDLGQRKLPYGAIICTAYVHAFAQLAQDDEYIAACMVPEDPRDTPRFGLFLSDVQPVSPIISCPGRQGIWYHNGIASPLDKQLNLPI